MPRRIAAWTALALFSALTVYGLIHNNLFAQEIWFVEGRRRLLIYAGSYWLWTALLRFFPTETFVRATAALALVYSLLVAGPLAVFAVLFILYACWLLGGGRDLIDLCTGLAILVFVVSFAVHVRTNNVWTYATAFAAIIGVGLWRRRAVWPPLWRIGAGTRGWERLFIELLGFALIAQLLVALQPEVGADGLGVHLNVAASVARYGLWDFNFRHMVWSVMPMGGDWLWTAAYILGGEMAARLMNFACLAVLAGVVTRAAGTALAGALFASSPLVQLVTGSLFVENVWTLFLVAAIVAIAQGRAYAAAILLGAAASCKFGALAFVVPALVLLVIRMPKRALPATALAVVFAVPPYTNAYLKTGNPLFPFFNATFKTPYFDQTTNFRDAAWTEPLRWSTPYDVTFHTRKYNGGQDGGFAFHILLLLPFAIVAFARRPPPLLWMSVTVAAAGFVLVFIATPYLRYVYPVLPLLSLVIAAAVLQSQAARVLAAAIIPLNVWFLATSGWYHRQFHVSTLFEPEAAQAYLRDSAAPRLFIDYLNERAPGEPVMFIRTNQSAGLAATAYTDDWYNHSFSSLFANAAAPVDCLRITNTRGIRWFIAPTSESGHRSPYAVLQPFLERYTRPRRVERFFQLARLMPEYEGREGLRRAEAAAAGVVIAAPGSYDDFHEALYFHGRWTRDHQFPQSANRSVTYSERPGDFARLVFRGSAVRYLYTMALNRGTASIEIDGIEKERIDLYSAETRWQQSRSFSGLPAGEHTLTVRVLPEKNPASAGNFVDVDLLIVE